MSNLKQFSNKNDLKDLLEVQIKPLQRFIKLSTQNETKVPVMIDIRTHNVKNNETEFTSASSSIQSTSQNPTDIERQPLDLIFVIDLSVSMRGKKMAQLRKTISNLMNFLNENDRMAVIGFNNSAQNLFNLSYLTQINKKKIMTILNNILPMGLTNMTAGLLEGLKQLEESTKNYNISESCESDEDEQIKHKKQVDNFKQQMQVQETEENLSKIEEKQKEFLSKSEQINSENNIAEELKNSCINFGQNKDERIKSIFLLSDGLDDRCEKNLNMLRTRIQSMQIQFSLNTFGYGVEHDANLMNEIAGFKEGRFYYIEDIDKTDFYFADALGGLFSVIGNQLEYEFQLSCDNQIKDMTISKVYGDMWTPIQQNNILQQRKELSNSSSKMCIEKKNKIDLNQHNQLISINNENEIICSRSFNLNQVFLGVSKQILLEITIPQQKGFTLNKHVIANGILKMKDLHGKTIQKTVELEVNLLDEGESIQEMLEMTNEDVEINYLRVQCAQSIQEAMNYALKNDYNQSRQTINQALDQIHKSKEQIQKSLVNLSKDLQECLETIMQKISVQQSNPNSPKLSCNSSTSTYDQNNNDLVIAHQIKRQFLCKSRAYMEQKSIMINLDEYQNQIQKNIQQQIQVQNQKKVFSAEQDEDEEVSQKPQAKTKRILIPLQRTRFQSMNV